MKTYARRRAATVFALAISAAVAGFTCDHPTEPEVLAGELSTSSVTSHRIEGVVTAKGSGLEGVSVVLKRTGATYTDNTDDEGAFRLESVSPGTYSTSARAVGVRGLPAEVVLTSLGNVAVDASMALRVDVPTHRLALNVNIGGVPLPGARVHCTMPVKANVGGGRIAQGVEVMAGLTGENGVFETPLLPTSARSSCTVFPLNNGWSERFYVPVVSEDMAIEVALPAISYRGVMSARGNPVPGHMVRLLGPIKSQTETGTDGRYDVKLAPGNYALAVAGEGNDALPRDFQLAASKRAIPSTTTENLDVPVAMLTLEVKGVGGAPVAGATVDQVVQGASFAAGKWSIVDATYRVRGTSDANGVLRLPMFPRTNAVDLAVRAPAGTGLMDGVLTLGAIGGDVAETLSLESANTAPVAHAGGPYRVNEGGSVALDGRGSTDPEGDALTYSWRLPDGSVVDDETVEVSFADGPADYEAVLTVTDIGGLSSSAAAKIEVANVAPSVEADDAAVVSGESFDLSASFADPGADRWSWVVDWGADLTSAGERSQVGPFSVASPVFLRAGEHTVRVTVSDDDDDAGSADVVVTVRRRSVGLDVLPGSSENPLSLNGNGGSVPVAVLSAGDFDATSLVLSSIRLSEHGEGGVPVSVRKNGSYMATFEDVNGDGVADLMLHFDRSALVSGLTENSSQLVLHGAMGVGVEVEGVDAIRPK